MPGGVRDRDRFLRHAPRTPAGARDRWHIATSARRTGEAGWFGRVSRWQHQPGYPPVGDWSRAASSPTSALRSRCVLAWTLRPAPRGHQHGGSCPASSPRRALFGFQLDLRNHAHVQDDWRAMWRQADGDTRDASRTGRAAPCGGQRGARLEASQRGPSHGARRSASRSSGDVRRPGVRHRHRGPRSRTPCRPRPSTPSSSAAGGPPSARASGGGALGKGTHLALLRATRTARGCSTSTRTTGEDPRLWLAKPDTDDAFGTTLVMADSSRIFCSGTARSPTGG